MIPALEVRNVSKRFPGVQALSDVSLDVQPGEVHCLMGENGAGKSTLLRILAGLQQADTGEILLQGKPCRFRSPDEAIRSGVAMIHQELMPFPELTVAENIFMGREPVRGWPGWIDRMRLRDDARAALQRLGVSIDSGRRMGELGVSETQMVEIAKAMTRKASLIIMDEPTSSLSHREVRSLFRLIGDLKAAGTAIIYVSHKMDEVFELGDRATVLRDGRAVGTDLMSNLDDPALITRMVGRPVGVRRRPPSAGAGEEILSVANLNLPGRFSDISFSVRCGEILGFAGLMGAGRTEVVSALYGIAPAESGSIRIRGAEVRIRAPRDALRHGIGFVSEDRKQLGLVLSASVKNNITLENLARCCSRGLIDRSAENTAADANIQRFRIKTAGREQEVGLLSGGNQQKVVMAKVMFGDPDILILDEPTRGIDIGAKQEIYGLIEGWAREGKAILLVSSELPEILALSDRVIVMRSGHIAAELPGDGLTQEQILQHAMPN